MDLEMLDGDEHIRDASVASRVWGVIGSLDSEVVKNMRPARAGIYDEDYPLPLVVSGGYIVDGGFDRPNCALSFEVHDRRTERTLNDYSRFEVTYYPSNDNSNERVCLLGAADRTSCHFQYVFSDGRWLEYVPPNAVAKHSKRWHPIDPARVCQVLRDYANVMVHDMGHPCFDAEILGAVGALPLPIAELVAWHLAPPSLEDCLLRRGLTNP